MKSNTPIDQSLAAHGLCVLGHCETVETDGLDQSGSLLLVGPMEPLFWPIFAQSPEYADGAENPLDRWSRRILTDIAKTYAAKALFPFGGKPFHPFFTWAKRSGQFWASPINFLVHEKAGLFVSFRGALLISDILPATHATSPCITCHAPCKSACPVDAFADGYDVDACKTHLASSNGTDCMSGGCLARRACPVGQGNRLPAQAAFHMKAFL